MLFDFLWSAYPDLPDETKWGLIETYCVQLLSRCTWTQMPDSGLTFTQQSAWLDYRQALKEVKETYANPDEAVIPSLPEGA